MRVSREQAEANHQTVINTASTLFREHGFDGIGLKDLMKGAGLTPGGFYKQFASKEDLVVQATGRALEQAAQRWSAAVEHAPDTPLEAVLGFYLSPEHVDQKGQGCPMVALGADAARQGPQVRAAFEAGVRSHLQTLAGLTGAAEQGAPSESAPSESAMVILSLMVGAMTLARAVNDRGLMQDILAAAAGAARRAADG